MKLFINTGGKGTRLYQLTMDVPKPMVQLLGKPILHHLIDWAKQQGISDIVLMNGHLAQRIIDYFGTGEHFGLHIAHST